MIKAQGSALHRALAGLLLLCVGFAATAADDVAPEGTFNVLVENDKFSGTDRHYTNGLQLSYLSPKNEVPGLLRSFSEILPGMPESAALRAGYVLGHNIYTPMDTTVRGPQPGERPYAGWLYGGFAVLAETENTLSTWELDLGIVGPSAGGEGVQNNFHRLIGVDEALGWRNQLHDEPGAALIYERKWRALAQTEILGLGVDATPHLGGSLGNVGTYLNAGLMLRLGKDLSNDFGAPRIRPSLPGSGFFLPRSAVGWYLFGGVDGRAIGRNLFLDGNTDGDSLSVSKRYFVADLQAGAAMTLGGLRLAYTLVYRTKEFSGQDRGDRFGAVSLSAKF